MKKDEPKSSQDLSRYEFSFGRLLRSLAVAVLGVGALFVLVEYGLACA